VRQPGRARAASPRYQSSCRSRLAAISGARPRQPLAKVVAEALDAPAPAELRRIRRACGPPSRDSAALRLAFTSAIIPPSTRGGGQQADRRYRDGLGSHGRVGNPTTWGWQQGDRRRRPRSAMSPTLCGFVHPSPPGHRCCPRPPRAQSFLDGPARAHARRLNRIPSARRWGPDINIVEESPTPNKRAANASEINFSPSRPNWLTVPPLPSRRDYWWQPPAHTGCGVLSPPPRMRRAIQLHLVGEGFEACLSAQELAAAPQTMGTESGRSQARTSSFWPTEEAVDGSKRQMAGPALGQHPRFL